MMLLNLTSLKLNYFIIAEKVQKCYLFDPDTFIYKNFDYVLNKLKNNSILLTPHGLKPEKMINIQI